MHAQRSQRAVLGFGFHAFGNHLNRQCLALPQNTLHNCPPHRVAVYLTHQIHIKLDDVWLKLRQQIEAGVAAKVINRRLESTATVFLR